MATREVSAALHGLPPSRIHISLLNSVKRKSEALHAPLHSLNRWIVSTSRCRTGYAGDPLFHGQGYPHVRSMFNRALQCPVKGYGRFFNHFFQKTRSLASRTPPPSSAAANVVERDKNEGLDDVRRGAVCQPVKRPLPLVEPALPSPPCGSHSVNDHGGRPHQLDQNWATQSNLLEPVVEVVRCCWLLLVAVCCSSFYCFVAVCCHLYCCFCSCFLLYCSVVSVFCLVVLLFCCSVVLLFCCSVVLLRCCCVDVLLCCCIARR